MPSTPLPELPVELHREILRFADPATLAAASRVSLAFLELSGPLLYTHVELRDFEHAQRLFYLSTVPTASSSLPAISPYLALSQMKTLVCRPESSVASGPPPPSLGRTRLVDGRLHLDAFTFILSGSSSFRFHAPALLEMVDPLVYRCVETLANSAASGAVARSPCSLWTRLRHLDIGSCSMVESGDQSSLTTLRTITMRMGDGYKTAKMRRRFDQLWHLGLLHRIEYLDRFHLSDPVLQFGINDAAEGEAILANFRTSPVGSSYDKLEQTLARVKIVKLGDEQFEDEP